MTTAILASLLLIAAGDFEARTLDGAHVEGRLVAVDGEWLTFETSAGRRVLPVGELMSVTPTEAPRRAERPSGVVIGLTDGSTFRAERFVVAGAQAELTPSVSPATCPVEAIRSVLLVEADDPALDEWNRLLREPFRADVLVVGRGEATDYHQGVLGGVSDDRVTFDLDGEVLRVKRDKVFGLIYYRPAVRELPPAVATLTDARGSRWSVRSISLVGNALAVRTPAGVAVECPLASVEGLDFSAGKILYLGQLEPRSAEWTPYFGLKEEPASRKAFFAPIRDPGRSGPPIVLAGRRYSHGIALRSRTEVVYDLPEGYRRLMATVGIDDALRPRGDAQLVIQADGHTLLDTTVTGTQPPQPVNLDVAGAQRLTIRVDFGQGMDLGDLVDLAEARLIK